MKHMKPVMLLVCSLLIASSAFAQVAKEANKGYQSKEGRANVVKTLTDPARDKTQKPDVVTNALGLHPGMTVADIGTGVGYMIPYLSKAVGPSGKILAEDIQTDFLDQVKARIASGKLTNVTPILGTETDPMLPANAADVELVLDVYHHFDYPEKMLAAFKTALKASGRLIIIEYYQDQVAPGHIRLDAAGVIKEIESSGFKLQSKTDRITARQFMLTFTKK
ncbi:MAG: methyltransferase domain-containing protein [Bryobacteraceae bacterium]